MSTDRIFHDDEHPMDEYTPHKPSSASSSNNSNSDNATSDSSENNENNYESNENIETKIDNHAASATTTPSKPKSGNGDGGKPSLAPPMGFTPSPVPISTKRHNQQQQRQQQQQMTQNETAQTADLLANIARRLGISPSKVESNGDHDVRIKTTTSTTTTVSSPSRNANIETTTHADRSMTMNTNANTSTAMASPAKSCRTLASGTLTPSSKANLASNNNNNNNTSAALDELDLSHMMEAHFDEAGEVATGQLVSDMRNGRTNSSNSNNNQRQQQQRQVVSTEAKQALVQDAMKRRFANNDNNNNASGNQDSLGTPAAPSRPSGTSTINDTPGIMSTPGSVPSVGLSAMLDGMAPTPPTAPGNVVGTPPTANGTNANVSSMSYKYEDIAAPTPATMVGGRAAGAGATMTIPEDGVVHHGNNAPDQEGDVSPSKIRFADMMSICEEGEMTAMMDESEEDATNRSVTSRGGRHRQRMPPSSPSVVNGSHDLSAMCDYVMDGSNSGANNAQTARPSTSSATAARATTNDESFLSTRSVADTVVNMTMARAAVQDESTVYDDVEGGGNINDTSVYSEATTTVTAHHHGGHNNDSSNMIAHDTASDLDMRGVSVFNHTTSTPVGGKSGSRADYSYPESTDSSSSGASPSGSSSLPSAASYEDHKGDMDKSRSDDSKIGCCLKFSREHWFLIATALLCLIGGLVGYGAAFGEWFMASSSSPASSVDSGYSAEEDGGTILDGVVDDQDGQIVEGDGSDSGNIVIPQFKTGSPTAAPDIPLTTVGDLSFQPKPVPVPRPGTSFAPPTRRPTPAPTNFRGHETFSFYVIGDIPYTPAEEIIVEHQIKNMAVDAVPYLDNEGAQFAVHVGDIMKGGRQADCSKWRYELVENLYKEHCPIPSFMLPGDNDWYDCPNPTAGWSNWMDSFGGMEVHWDGTTTLPSRVQRQSVRRENFAFHHGGVLFIGANLVSKEPYDINANYRKRMNENREWVRQVVRQYQFNKNPAMSDQDSIRAIFAFGHHRQSQFWRSLQDDIEDLDVPLIYFHGNGHTWSSQQPFSDWKNVWISQVDMGGIAPPIKVTIQGTTEIARQYPPRKMSPHHIMMGSSIHVDRRGGTIKGPWSTSSFD